MPLFGHKENRDITATSPATNNAYGNDAGYQTGGPVGNRGDIYDPAYDNTSAGGNTFGRNEPYGTHGNAAAPTTGYNNNTMANEGTYTDTTFANQPGSHNRRGDPTVGGTNDYGNTTRGTGLNDNYDQNNRATGLGALNDDNYDQNTRPTGLGAMNDNPGATGRGPAVGNNQGTGVVGGQQSTTAYPSDRQARQLERSGKIEKAIGTVLCSTTMKQKGLEKQAEAANISMQAEHLNEAERLEAQARAMRGNAVGLGAHPNHLNPAGQQPGNTGQFNNTY
ncbi:hypothetical protein FRB90_000822 [Tulasnella sp. 427]|nr:hypothetical protein FRB90_000822 [Tulasnella sp. 427]